MGPSVSGALFQGNPSTQPRSQPKLQARNGFVDVQAGEVFFEEKNQVL